MHVWDAAPLLRVFAHDFYLDERALERAIIERRLVNAVHFETLVKVDLVIRKDTPYREEEFDRRRPAIVAGRQIWVVTAEDLLLSKLLWWTETESAVQWRDLEQLAKLALDWTYIEHWGAQLQLAAPLRRLRL